MSHSQPKIWRKAQKIGGDISPASLAFRKYVPTPTQTTPPYPAEHPSQRLLADRAALAPTLIVLAGSTWSEEF